MWPSSISVVQLRDHRRMDGREIVKLQNHRLKKKVLQIITVEASVTEIYGGGCARG